MNGRHCCVSHQTNKEIWQIFDIVDIVRTSIKSEEKEGICTFKKNTFLGHSNGMSLYLSIICQHLKISARDKF